MSRYTLHFFDDDGECEEIRHLDCRSDGEAINALHDQADSRPTELWRDETPILCRPGRPKLKF